MTTKKLSPKLQARFKKTQEAAHERVVQRGTIQFRLDAAGMENLLRLADACKTPAGVLARMWVMERLSQELDDKPSLESRLDRVEQLLKIKAIRPSSKRRVRKA